MLEFLVTLGAVALVVAVIVTVVVIWALTRTFRSIRRRAGRTARRLQVVLPVQSFGSRLWWLAGRLDRVEEQAGYAETTASRTFLSDDMASLAAELHTSVSALRAQVQAAAQLSSGPQRDREAERLEVLVAELEAGATQLVETSAHLNHLHVSRDGIGVGESVRRRAAALDAAVEELSQLDRLPDLPPMPQTRQQALQAPLPDPVITPAANDPGQKAPRKQA